MSKRTYRVLAACLSVIALTVPAALFAQSASSTANDIQRQVDERNQQISQLGQQISQYQQQLDTVSAKKQTLQNTISQINISINKTNASIKLTKNQIGLTQLQISQLARSIATKQASLDDEQAGAAAALRSLNEADTVPLIIAALSSSDISTVWEDVAALDNFQAALQGDIARLRSDKAQLSDSKTAAEAKKQQLQDQQKTLVTQQGSLSSQKQAQNQLLAQTKSQESTYQQLIAQKKAQQADLQRALTDLQSAYNQQVNPSSYPPPTPGMMAWPIYGKIRITQYFGNTPFSQSRPSLYSGNGHDGLDIAAPIGTPVHAALSGVVLATGNTDAVKGCYSFGKWVMIKHNNGLNTMYAHLSQISVTPGEQISTGDVLGYSGVTGYATGPHLHFGVYVSAVTQIIPLGQATKTSRTPCHLAVMPVPPVSGYLNPLNYLSSL